MNISFDLSCLFDGSLGYDLKKKDEYKKNLEKCIFASEKLTSEVEQRTNSIINSFELNIIAKLLTYKLYHVSDLWKIKPPMYVKKTFINNFST